MSPIVGLTNQKPQFPQIGQLRKGLFNKEEKRPIDLDYFRFTSDIPEVEEAFESAYGEEPQLVNVFLPHEKTDENWEAWYEEYVASGLIHRCDGEYVTRYRNSQTGKYEDAPPGTMKCPYHSGEKERTKEHPGCQPAGRLQVVIPELRRLAYVMVLTSSKNDIMHLDGQIRALESINGNLTGIPMQLRRRPEKISTPKMTKKGQSWVETGERARRESWLLSIEAAPKFVDLQIEAQELAALPDVPKQLEGGEGWKVVEETGEIVKPEIKEPEPVEVEEEVEEIEEEPLKPTNMLTLGEALGTPLTAPVPGLELEKGDYLLQVVKKDGKNVVEYLTKPSSYKRQNQDNLRLQDAAIVVLENWDKACEVVQEGGTAEGETIEEGGDNGEETPLF